MSKFKKGDKIKVISKFEVIEVMLFTEPVEVAGQYVDKIIKIKDIESDLMLAMPENTIELIKDN